MAWATRWLGSFDHRGLDGSDRMIADLASFGLPVVTRASAASLSFYDFSALGGTHYYRKQYKNLLDLLPWSQTEQVEYISEYQLAYQLNIELFDELGALCGVESRTGLNGNDFFAS